MNLIEKIDILIDTVYNQKISNQSISNIFESKGIDYDYDSSHVICEKVYELGIFRTINTSSSSGADFILNSNPTGLDFVNEFQSYSNFLIMQKVEQESEQKANKIKEKWAIKDAKGSYFAGIGAIIAIPISILSLLYTLYQDTTQKSKDKEFNDSLKILKIELIELKKSIRKHEILHSNIDSLVNVKKK